MQREDLAQNQVEQKNSEELLLQFSDLCVLPGTETHAAKVTLVGLSLFVLKV